MGLDERILEALRTLIECADERIDRSPMGHLLAGRRENLHLQLRLPLGADPEAVEQVAGRLETALAEAIDAALQRRVAFRPGTVLCLRCSSTECGHGRPTSSRQVFAGYSPSGTPEFLDLGELLLSRRDPRVGELFDEGRAVVTHLMGEEDLCGRLLDVFKEQRAGYRIHGQVVAGWYRLPDPTGRPQALALSFQAVSTCPRRSPRRFGLNVLGLGPDGEPLAHLHDRMAAIPWAAAVRWAHSALSGLASAPARRVEGILRGLARRLERGQRAHGRRTHHAQRRHVEGGRPTRMALLDLTRAGENDLLFDTRHKTLVVLGERGRCHVFGAGGRLVTSVRYPPATIERRRQAGLWRRATPEERQALAPRTDPDEDEKK